MFHDVTKMPTSTDDVQQIHKKRHVGNDNVHIVWSEHKRNYNPATITSQFNHAHIIVYPIPNGLYRIQLFQKEKIAPFGPLSNGMVLSKAILAPLVRATAMNANFASRKSSDMYARPFIPRIDLIKEITDRYKVPFSLLSLF